MLSVGRHGVLFAALSHRECVLRLAAETMCVSLKESQSDERSSIMGNAWRYTDFD